MNWKKIGKKLLFPPVWLMALLVTACAAALTVVFVRHMEQSIPAYLVYALSFYTLCVFTVFCVIPAVTREKPRGSPVIAR